ncbi:MAG: hypothetical protein OWU32_08230 [Firmicutes bacterium]|nr:hypothetical protein [Bacillota bacterium]
MDSRYGTSSSAVASDVSAPVHWVDIAVPVLVLAGTLATLFWPPQIGLANNGDYQRLLALFGLHYGQLHPLHYERYDNFWVKWFMTGGHSTGYYVSSAVPVIAIAAAINFVLHPGLFDQQVVGVIYTILWSLASYFIIREVRLAYGASIALFAGVAGFVVMGDVAYTAYLPTVYSEPASFIFWWALLACACAMLQQGLRPSRTVVLLSVAAGTLFLIGKLQNIVLTPAVILFWVALDHLLRWPLRRRAMLLTMLVSCLVAASAWVLNPPTFDQQNVYDSTFTGIAAPGTPVVEHLKWFGLPAADARFSGDAFFSPYSWAHQTQLTRSGFYEKMGMLRIVEFYVTHPRSLWRAMQASEVASLAMRPDYLGNFQEASGLAPMAKASRMSLWSTAKGHLPASLWVWIAFYVAFCAGLVVSWRRSQTPRERGRVLLCSMIAACALLQFPVPFVGEGSNELVKHLYLSDVLTDTMILITAIWGAGQLRRGALRRMTRRKRPASDQAASDQTISDGIHSVLDDPHRL